MPLWSYSQPGTWQPDWCYKLLLFEPWPFSSQFKVRWEESLCSGELTDGQTVCTVGTTEALISPGLGVRIEPSPCILQAHHHCWEWFKCQDFHFCLPFLTSHFFFYYCLKAISSLALPWQRGRQWGILNLEASVLWFDCVLPVVSVQKRC